MRYDYENLIAYCSDNELKIKTIEDNKCNRETVIEGHCKTPNCSESFNKSFRQLVKVGGFCEECSKINGIKKNENVQTDKHFKSLGDYCNEHNIQLLKSYEEQRMNRDTIIEVKCNTSECCETFNKPLRQLFKIGGFCLECSKNNGKIKIIDTTIKKFGCENAMQNKDVKEAIRITTLAKYGVEHNSQSLEIKQRKKDKSMAKYGVEYVLQSPEIREKIAATNFIRYGAENPQQNKEIKSKTTETVLDKYGTTCVLSIEEFKEKSRQTNIKRYGVEHHMQNAAIANKGLNAAYKTKQYTMPSGKIINYQGYENYGLDSLLFDENIDETDIITCRKEVPEIWYFDINGKRHRHFVDIFIKSQNRCVEIKSTWTNQSKNWVFEKQKSAKELGYEYEIWIYSKEGKRLFTY